MGDEVNMDVAQITRSALQYTAGSAAGEGYFRKKQVGRLLLN